VSASDIAIATIKLEHRSLGMVLHTLQGLLTKVAAGHAVADFGLLATALYYIDDFPEYCHHPKEDEYLFKRLRLRTREFDAVLERLQTEHARSAIAVSGLHRALVHYQGGAPEGLRLFQAAVDSYAAEMREHFASEDALMARAPAVLLEEDCGRLPPMTTRCSAKTTAWNSASSTSASSRWRRAK
jgi:hemerythrin-like domain-containing protein